ncbi:uncharacterized protein LOC128210549 [Mya arenaria]|uniref:uncharacterized protein LOC128210549 n=1 Tax=Mya arenaria TaxID=6604 RepID=UPI0022E83810|nr:uncharacterized protein LOC128210549 [Mya arenaria]
MRYRCPPLTGVVVEGCEEDLRYRCPPITGVVVEGVKSSCGICVPLTGVVVEGCEELLRYRCPPLTGVVTEGCEGVIRYRCPPLTAVEMEGMKSSRGIGVRPSPGFTSHVEGFSQRKIYTLHTEAKTWNEAHAVCEDQQGHLIKVKDGRELGELLFLDTPEGDWNGQLASLAVSNNMWTGLHQPYFASGDVSWEYHDCEPSSPNVNISGEAPGLHCAAFDGASLVHEATNCADRLPFICQRFTGDCWYEPFALESVIISASNMILLNPGLTASKCAVLCRSEYVSLIQLNDGDECWGFYFVGVNRECILLHPPEVTASSNYARSANRKPFDLDPDLVFYVKRCFEGEVDTEPYNEIKRGGSQPDTTCDIEAYPGDVIAGEVCFCSTQNHPPIPPTTSSEEAAAELERELSLDTSNTSSAIRSKTSAEDNRPSAIGVGASLGAGMLAFVFGGLFLMDLPVLIAGVKEILCTSAQASAHGEEFDA